MLSMLVENQIRSVDLKDGKLVVIKRIPSGINMTNGAPIPDRLVKEIYGVKGNDVVLEKVVNGSVVPSRYIPEEYIFDE